MKLVLPGHVFFIIIGDMKKWSMTLTTATNMGCLEFFLLHPKIFTSSGLNFINVLLTAFMQVDPECAKKRRSSQQCHLALLGPTIVKAALKMLVKLTLYDRRNLKKLEILAHKK